MQGRSFIQRIINYWALLTLGPLLLGLGFYLSTHHLFTGDIQGKVLIYIRPSLISVIY